MTSSKSPSWVGDHIYVCLFFLTSCAWEEADSGVRQSRPTSEKLCLHTRSPLFLIPGRVKWKSSDVSAGIYGSVELRTVLNHWSIKQTEVTVSPSAFCHITTLLNTIKKETNTNIEQWGNGLNVLTKRSYLTFSRDSQVWDFGHKQSHIQPS